MQYRKLGENRVNIVRSVHTTNTTISETAALQEGGGYWAGPARLASVFDCDVTA